MNILVLRNSMKEMRLDPRFCFPERRHPAEVFPAPPPEPDIPGTALVMRFFVCGRGDFFRLLTLQFWVLHDF